jgi:hypothetical protein
MLANVYWLVADRISDGRREEKAKIVLSSDPWDAPVEFRSLIRPGQNIRLRLSLKRSTKLLYAD